MRKQVCSKNISYGIYLLALLLTTGQPALASDKSHPETEQNKPATTQQGKTTEVSGTVSDSSGPIIGASVRVKGSGVGTITDLDGNFKLKVAAGSTLEISYIGYVTKELRYNGESKLNITLGEDVHQLQEVQIIAYGTTKKATITGALSSIGSEEILKSPVGNLANSLAGKVTGFSSVQSTGQPGADDPKIYVRGVGSMSTNLSTPLVLVDGVERSFFRLDPNEVEDITILKDASATAVFGVRGANGVILVTTKRGQEGKAKVSFSTSYALQMPTTMPEVANSYEHAMAFVNAQKRDGDDEAKYKFTPAMIEAFRTGSNPLAYPDVDWLDLLMKKSAFQSQHNLTVSGGSKSVRYFASLGIFTQDGLFKSLEKNYSSNYNYNRYNYRINMDIDVTKTTSMQVNLGGRIEDKRLPNYNSGTYTDLRYLFRDIYMAVPFGGAGLVDGKRVVVDGSTFGQLGAIYDGLNASYGKGYSTKSENTLNFDFVLTQKLDFITKGLKIHAKGSYNSGMSLTKRREGREAIYQAILKDDGSTILKKTGEESNLAFVETYGKTRDWYLEAAINYKRDFGQHHVTGMAMYNQTMKYYIDGPSAFFGIPRSYVGLVGRVTYDFATRYLMDFSIGYNGSENFAKGKQFGTFPAGSIGWILTEENFLQFLKPTINYFKIRASYGIVGNDRVDDKSRFLFLPDSYNISSGSYNFGTNTSTMIVGSSEAKKGNPNVTWEKSAKQNYGVDLHFLDSKLKTSFDFFKERRWDILLPRTIAPGYLAVTLPTGNIGKVNNQGYEASIRWEDRVKEFNYYLGVNLSYAKSKIMFMDEVKYPYDYMQRTGHPVGQRFGYKYDGYFSEADVAKYATESGKSIPDHGFTPRPGDVKYKDLNGDHKIDNKDVTAIGNPVYPLLTGGINAGFSYKGFDFSMTWAGAAKTSRLVTSLFREPFGGKNSDSILKYMIDDAWTPEKGNSAKAPALSFASKSNNYKDSDLWVRDASYLRLKNIEIGYALPGRIMKKTALSNFRIFVSGYNLLTFSDLKMLDPEADPSSEVEYPVIRVVNIGLKFGF